MGTHVDADAGTKCTCYYGFQTSGGADKCDGTEPECGVNLQNTEKYILRSNVGPGSGLNKVLLNDISNDGKTLYIGASDGGHIGRGSGVLKLDLTQDPKNADQTGEKYPKLNRVSHANMMDDVIASVGDVKVDHIDGGPPLTKDVYVDHRYRWLARGPKYNANDYPYAPQVWGPSLSPDGSKIAIAAENTQYKRDDGTTCSGHRCGAVWEAPLASS